jgi:hypothetical protein
MFGLFNRHKEERKELAQLEAEGAAHSTDPFKRRRHAWLVSLLRGGLAALPYYDAIAADFPGSWRMAYNAATIRLMAGDAAGIAQMEAVAEARSSLAVSAYQLLLHFFDARQEEGEIQRIRPMVAAAFDRFNAAMAEGRFEDAGGPVESSRYNSDDLDFIWKQLHGHRKTLQELLAGSRLLADGTRQQILLVSCAPGIDPAKLVQTLYAVGDHFGEYVLFPLNAEREWLAEQLREVEGGQLYP